MPKYHVLLDQKTADALREQGINSLSKGIELMFRARACWEQETRTGPTKRTMATPEPKLPADPRNLSNHGGTTNRLAREDREAEAKKALAWKTHKSLLHWEIEQCGDLRRLDEEFFAGMPDSWRDLNYVFTPEELAQAYEDHTAHVGRVRASNLRGHINAAETKRLRDAGLPDTRVLKPVQTIALTVTAMRRLGLFGTPEGLTDAQIAELNEGYKDAAPTEGIGEEIDEEYNPNLDNE